MGSQYRRFKSAGGGKMGRRSQALTASGTPYNPIEGVEGLRRDPGRSQDRPQPFACSGGDGKFGT